MSHVPAVLLIGGSLMAVPMVREIQALGFQCLVTDRNPACAARASADAFFQADTYDREEHIAVYLDHIVPSYTLRGVLCCSADVSATVAYVATLADLPRLSPKLAIQSQDKLAVRQCLTNAGLHHLQPRWEQWRPQQRTSLVYPCVLKPLHQRASRGVTMLRDARGLAAALERLESEAVVLAEEWLEGSEHSADMLFDADGQLVHFHLCDRFFDYSRGVPIELGHVNPSSLSPERRDACKHAMLQAAQALGVRWGPWKCDLLYTEDGPKILECATRISGGWDSQWSYPLSSGDNMLKRTVQIVCGLPIDPAQPALYPPTQYVAVAAILPLRSGRIMRLPTCVPSARWHVAEGDSITVPLEHNGQRLGFILTVDTDGADVWASGYRRARTLAAEVVIEGSRNA